MASKFRLFGQRGRERAASAKARIGTRVREINAAAIGGLLRASPADFERSLRIIYGWGITDRNWKTSIAPFARNLALDYVATKGKSTQGMTRSTIKHEIYETLISAIRDARQA